MVMGEAVLRDRVIPLQRSEIRGKRGRGGEEKKKIEEGIGRRFLERNQPGGRRRRREKKRDFGKGT